MMTTLTTEDIANLRYQYKNVTRDGILCDLAYIEYQIKKYEDTLTCWKDQMKILETILDERTE